MPKRFADRDQTKCTVVYKIETSNLGRLCSKAAVSKQSRKSHL